MAILAIAAALAAQAAGAQPDLDWLAGYWLSCDERMEVAETWSDRRGGIMLGTSITIGDDAFSWEQMRIESDGESLVYHAEPRGQAATAFPLVQSGPGEAVFENPDHDFPQRVIYRRTGDRLTARIEGMSGGSQQSMEWHFQSAPHNGRCAGRSGR